MPAPNKSIFFKQVVISIAIALTPVALARHERVMTQNLYFGADLFSILPSIASGDLGALASDVTELWGRVQATNFPERAQAIAAEISSHRPHVIALQEVALWRTQVPGDTNVGNPVNATDVAQDFLEILMKALDERKLHYSVAATVNNFDVELPMLTVQQEDQTPILSDLRFTDRDVTLVKKSKSLDYSNVLAKGFSDKVVFPVGNQIFEFSRGYNILDVRRGKEKYRFVNAHLDESTSEPFKSIQTVQMNELLQVIENTTDSELPVIFAGDLNSNPTQTQFVSNAEIPELNGQTLTPPYMQALNAGYIDIWSKKRGKNKDGFTCCFDKALKDKNAALTIRVDHILVSPKNSRLDGTRTTLIGENVDDMTEESALHPSDHAGVVGRIKFSTS